MSASQIVALLLVVALAQGASAQLGFGGGLGGNTGFYTGLSNHGVITELGEDFPTGNHLAHHDIIVGAAPWVENRRPFSYWQPLDAGAANSGFAPIYATKGDRLVFYVRNTNRRIATVPSEDAFNNCRMTHHHEFTFQEAHSPGAATPQLTRKLVVELRETGEHFFVDVGACNTGMRLRVHVATGRTPRWDFVGGANDDVRNHQWIVGGDAHGWEQLSTYSLYGFAPIWAAQGDVVGFSYGSDSDVYEFTSKVWFDTCNFVLANRRAASNHGCPHTPGGAAPTDNADGARPCNLWGDNRYNHPLPNVGNFYFASYSSTLFDLGGGNLANLFLQGNSALASFQYQNWACTKGRQKVEVHVFPEGQQINVATCNTFTSKLFLSQQGTAPGLAPAQGNSVINPWLFSLFDFNEECYDPFSYIYSTHGGLTGNGDVDPWVARNVAYNSNRGNGLFGL